MFLATIGLYGLKAYVVSRRTREIGIRVALGATPSSVIWLVVREGLTWSALGLAVGAILAFGAGLGMRSLVYQGRSADPLILTIVTARARVGRTHRELAAGPKGRRDCADSGDA